MDRVGVRVLVMASVLALTAFTTAARADGPGCPDAAFERIASGRGKAVWCGKQENASTITFVRPGGKACRTRVSEVANGVRDKAEIVAGRDSVALLWGAGTNWAVLEVYDGHCRNVGNDDGSGFFLSPDGDYAVRHHVHEGVQLIRLADYSIRSKRPVAALIDLDDVRWERSRAVVTYHLAGKAGEIVLPIR